MKCEHCGKQEATFYLYNNCNGRVSQRHLCRDCATAQGYIPKRAHALHPAALFSDSFFNDDFFARPFSLLAPFFGESDTGLFSEFPAPTEEASHGEKPAHGAKAEPSLVSREEREALRAQRRRNALEAQLRDAVAHEDFEHAIQLRDELRKMAS